MPTENYQASNTHLHPADAPSLEITGTKQLHANCESSKPPKAVSGSRDSHPDERHAGAFQSLLKQKGRYRKALSLPDPRSQIPRVLLFSCNSVPVILSLDNTASTGTDGA